jgi:hypothetical protein
VYTDEVLAKLGLNKEKLVEKKAIEAEKRVQFYEATLRACFVDAPCDEFNDRIARVEGGTLYVGDFKCKLDGEPGEGGYGACRVTLANGRPVAAKQWDPEDGFVTTTVVIGNRTKTVDKERLANPYIALQQQRIRQMIEDFEAERRNGDLNCKGLAGRAKVECYGAQTP